MSRRALSAACCALLVLWCATPLLAEDPPENRTEEERREEASDRLIEMSIVLGRLQRLKSKLDGGNDIRLDDLDDAVGPADGPQERLLAEKQALELLEERLQTLRHRGKEEPATAPVEEAPAEQEGAELSIEGALQRMGPPPLPESSRELAHLLRENGYYGLALDAYGRIPKAERTSWDRFHMGVCYEKLGDMVRARSVYRRVSLEAKDTPLGEHARWVVNTYLVMAEEIR